MVSKISPKYMKNLIQPLLIFIPFSESSAYYPFPSQHATAQKGEKKFKIMCYVFALFKWARLQR